MRPLDLKPFPSGLANRASIFFVTMFLNVATKVTSGGGAAATVILTVLAFAGRRNRDSAREKCAECEIFF